MHYLELMEFTSRRTTNLLPSFSYISIVISARIGRFSQNGSQMIVSYTKIYGNQLVTFSLKKYFFSRVLRGKKIC